MGAWSLATIGERCPDSGQTAAHVAPSTSGSVSTSVVGYDRKTGKWEECAETVDASRTGITLLMNRRVRHGSVLYLTLPLPARLRNHAGVRIWRGHGVFGHNLVTSPRPG